MSNEGFFLCLEGIDGSGKSSTARWIMEFLQQQAVRTIHTREPGGTPAAEKIRETVLWGTDGLTDDFSNWGEVCLYMAARSTHVENLILPSLKAGTVVLCERFCDSTYAHQGGGRGMDINTLKQLHQMVIGDLKPDMTILLDGDPEVFARRMGKEERVFDRLERTGLDFQYRSREIHLNEARLDPHRYLVVNAELSEDQVRAQITPLLMNIVNLVKRRPLPLNERSIP